MNLIIESDPVPLAMDEDGVAKIVGTRVPLETIVAAFEEGASAEEIALRYTSVRLADVYRVIAYYLEHQQEVREYLEQRDLLAQQARLELEARYNLVGIRERLLTRQAQAEANANSARR